MGSRLLLLLFSVFYSSFNDIYAVHGPNLKLQSNFIDFGVVKYKDPVPTRDIIITNRGDQKLVILRTYTDCSCTIVDNKVDTIYPGKSDVLRIKFKAKKLYPGEYTKKIYLKSNTKTQIDTIVVHADVRHN